MLILGIETATPRVGCAFGGQDGVLAAITSRADRRHAEMLTPMIDAARVASGTQFQDLGAIAVDIGPGLFTGLRVGIATAKAMAYALSLPMVGISSLDLLAFGVRYTSRTIVAMVDARRGEVFTADYRQVPGGVQRIGDPRVCPPDEVASHLMAIGGDTLLVGDGAHRYASTFEDLPNAVLADPRFTHPDPAALVELARSRAVREEFVPHWELRPLYLRKPDAEINWTTRSAEGRTAAP